MIFVYELIHNESEETDGSEGFQFSKTPTGTIEADDFEGVVDWMKDEWGYLSNGEWDWQCNIRGTSGEVRFYNRDDGMAVVFEVRRKIN